MVSVPKSHYLKFVLSSNITAIIYLFSFCSSPLAAYWFTNTVQTCFSMVQLSQVDRSCLLDWTEVTNQPASYALLLVLPLFVFPLCPRTHLVRYFFFCCTVWNSLPCKVRSSNRLASLKSSLKSHLFKLSFCACVCVCVCVRVCVCACVHESLLWPSFGSLHCNGLCAPVWKNSP